MGSVGGARPVLESILNESRVGVLDGGFATHLEDAFGLSLPSPLWSATLLDPEYKSGDLTGHDYVRATHQAFLEAGARIIETASYQASEPSFSKPGAPASASSRARECMISSVQLGKAAMVESAKAPSTLLALSLGPYGAFLEGGREYTGDYALDAKSSPEEVTEAMSKFHQDRLQTFASDQDQELWKSIDLIACETIPRLDEAQVILQALESLKLPNGPEDTHKPPVLLSFVFPGGKEDDAILPFQSEVGRSCQDIAKVLCTAAEQAGYPIVGVGVNCTKPFRIAKVVGALRDAFKEHNTRGFSTATRKPALFVYPDGGLTWDGVNRCWIDSSGSEQSDAEPTKNEPSKWADNLISNVSSENIKDDVFDSIILGGCCKASKDHIKCLSQRVYSSV